MSRRTPGVVALAVALAAGGLGIARGAPLDAARERPAQGDAWSVVPPEACAEPSPAAPLSGETERDLPDYDGRPPAGMSATALALGPWRTALAPIVAGLERLGRRPLGWIVTAVERVVSRRADAD